MGGMVSGTLLIVEKCGCETFSKPAWELAEQVDFGVGIPAVIIGSCYGVSRWDQTHPNADPLHKKCEYN